MELRYSINGTPRQAARLAAVQVLYQIEQSEEEVTAVLNSFQSWIGEQYSEEVYKKKIDISFFQKLVIETHKNLIQTDKIIEKHLKSAWTLDRLPSVLRVILRLAVQEIKFAETPGPVIVNEYIELTKDFFLDTEAAFVNAVLDSIYASKSSFL